VTHRRETVAIVAAAFLALSIGASPSAEAATTPGEVVAEGVVVDAEGTAAEGAVVEAYAWPRNETLAAMKPGAHFQLMPVAHGRHGDATRMRGYQDRRGGALLGLGLCVVMVLLCFRIGLALGRGVGSRRRRRQG
jgi:hypothetical protein